MYATKGLIPVENSPLNQFWSCASLKTQFNVGGLQDASL